MARIRSIHPAIFTDEAFVSVSMTARVLLMGLWTEADDQGVFDWKPITIKMRLMPVDNVDVVALLDELERADVIRRFTDDSRALGAIRNFCKFQRPKTPKYRPLKSADIRKYVASTYPVSETDQAEPSQFPQNGEMAPQMEEGGGRMEEEREEEEEKSLSPAKPRTSASAGFEDFQAVYPRRDGPLSWEPARKKFEALVKTAVDPQSIVNAAKQFAAEEAKRGNVGTRFVPQPAKWLGERRFQDYAAATFEASQPDGDLSEREWHDVAKTFSKTGHWSRHAGNDPSSPGCRCPPEILTQYGITMQSETIQ